MKTQAVGYSYVRFSSKEQRKGHSLERQTEKARAWCLRNGVLLDTSRTWHDLGTSAFLGEHRSNPDRHALAAFLHLVKAAQIPRGSFLIIESLDRLTREDVWSALELVTGLLSAGIRIVQLSPVEQIIDKSSGPMVAMMTLMELSRGNSESQTKSDRIGPVWAKKKRGARDGKILTRRLPAWVTIEGGRLALIEDRAAIVRDVFALATAGYGIPSIIQRLTADRVPPFGRSGAWTRAYVNLILNDRRAAGAYQPKKGKAHDGPVIPDYYPAVVTADQWNAARAATLRRKKNPGRLGGTPQARKINVFAGLLTNARDGDSYMMVPHASRSGARLLRKYQVLINHSADEGRGRAYSIPYDVFEGAVFGELLEIDHAEVLGVTEPDDLGRLGAEKAVLEAELGALSAQLDATVSQRLMDQVVRREQRLALVIEQLAAARARAASPLSGGWADARQLVGELRAAAGAHAVDLRLRLRGALRRIVERIYLLVVPVGPWRLVATQMFFTGAAAGVSRSYLFGHRPAFKKPAVTTEPDSFAEAGLPGAADLDLRKPDHVARLTRVLEKTDTARLAK